MSTYTTTDRFNAEQKVYELQVSVSMATAVLDSFLSRSTERGMFSASEVQDLALDIRAALSTSLACHEQDHLSGMSES